MPLGNLLYSRERFRSGTCNLYRDGVALFQGLSLNPILQDKDGSTSEFQQPLRRNG